ncbi:MAG: hypothetical protein V7739_11200 [Motiliproteus sp.]
MSSTTDPLAFWQHRRNSIYSRKGGWRIGEAVYNHGYSMMEELVGEVSYFQLMMLNVTGKLPERALAEWLEAAFICLSWPDSRIWCNQIGALAGDSRASPVAATTAGILASDSRLYGPGVLSNCMGFIQAALLEVSAGTSIGSIVERTLQRGKGVPGYARPIAKGDERVTAMQRVGNKLEFEVGEYQHLALSISDYLSEHHQESINFGGYMAAFLADQGLDIRSVYRISACWVAAGVQACYAEAADNPAGSYLPLRCDDVIYCGRADRELLL